MALQRTETAEALKPLDLRELITAKPPCITVRLPFESLDAARIRLRNAIRELEQTVHGSGDLLEPLKPHGGPRDGSVDLVVGHAVADLVPLDRLAAHAAALGRICIWRAAIRIDMWACCSEESFPASFPSPTTANIFWPSCDGISCATGANIGEG